ncbi:hypothetical protein DM02DRAFT_608166 [Periconia macrospinosa]|uniref:Zn(2)-C6 fungal-type domain-containing protein n=1 Tax=Periconia macrospinosa TaxID=97972 RepID=A0A2V1EF25_9PLEO|nr:hypothetical protein DM02DRAFT_608166 [Periconia macrospinosa]
MRPLRPLLPATEGSRPRVEREPPPKKQRIQLACAPCRQRKIKCDGTRPSCHACVRNKTDCEYPDTESRQVRQRYEQLQQQKSAHEELVELLKNAPEQDASDIVRRLRAGMDVASIVNYVRDGNLLLQLALAPETHRIYPFPHLAGMPDYLFISDNPYLDSSLYKVALSYEAPRLDTSSPVISDQPTSSVNPGNPGQQIHRAGSPPASSGTNHHKAYSVPYRAARLIEPIIDKVAAKPWTNVIYDDQLFRQLIRIYFEQHRPCGPFVHKDLFLEDMAAGRTRFCSPLLVNAILASAVQSCSQFSNRSKIWLPDSLTYKFLAEVRRLWEMQQLSKKSRITTIQAASLLSYTFANNGLDETGTIYLEQAVAMSDDLNLFGLADSDTSPNMRKVRIFTAWSLFTWQALFDLCFFRAPHVKQPPQEKLPDPAVDPKWYGEVWLQYPSSPTPIPLYLGHILHAQMTLHIIMNEMASLSFGGPTTRSLTAEEIVALVRRLYKWKDTLPEPLKPQNILHPPHLALHVQYLQVLILLMKALTACSDPKTAIVSDLCAGSTPDLVLSNANLMLETVMRLYYMRHSFQLYDPWITFALTIVGNNAIENLASHSGNNSRSRDGYLSTLILSAQGLLNQGSNYHLATLVAVQLQSAMQPSDLQLVQTYVTAAGVDKSDQRLMVQHSHSHWVIPLIGISDDPKKYTLKELVKAFEDADLQASDVSSQEGTPPPR